MVMVMTVHTGFITNLHSVKLQLDTEPAAAYFMSAMQSSTIICVNLFVMVSGYFGIQTTFSRLLKFMYMCVFWGVGVYLAYCIIHEISGKGIPLNIQNILIMFVPGNSYWFARAYIALMIVAPGLNLIMKKMSPALLLTVAVGYYLFQFIGDSLTTVYEDLWVGGFSAYSFIGLYIIGAAVSRFKTDISLSAGSCLGIYLLLTVVATLLALSELPSLGWFYARNIRYNSWVIILSGLFFFIAFTRFKFTSHIVNFLAGSAFAVYLFHEHPLIQPYFRRLFGYIWKTYEWWMFPIFQAGIFAGIYMTATLVDQVRIYSWRWIDRMVDFEGLLDKRIVPLVYKAGKFIFASSTSKK